MKRGVAQVIKRRAVYTLLVIFFLTVSSASAQIIWSDNFDDVEVSNITPAAAGIPLPSGQEFLPLPPVESSVVSLIPAGAGLIGVGPVATGSNVVNVQAALGQFSAPVDIYFGISAPAIDPVNIYSLTPTGLLTLAHAGLVPWMSNTIGNINVSTFGNIPISQLLPGSYTLYLAGTAASSTSTYYLREASFMQSAADITACDSQGCISEAKLSANISNTLANHVVGYVILVGGMPPVYGGLARTTSDPPSLAMSPDLVTNIASVSKTITATAVLQLLAKAGLSVDTKISPFIYPDWQQGPNVNRLTFKELLAHTSGFAQLPNNACGNDITYANLKTIVATGVSARNIGRPSYGNCNFALLRELMPALSGQSLSGLPDGSQRAQQSSAQYITYVNAHVFQPVGVPTSACKPPSGSDYILSYPNPAGTAKGSNWGDWSLRCGNGGWVLSANNIFSVINNLAIGTTLLTEAQKQQMFSECLGWDCSVRSDCPNPYVCKNGDLYSGPTSVWTYAGVLKCNVPVVVVVNSPLPAPYQGGEDIIGLVKDAYQASSVPGTPKACP